MPEIVPGDRWQHGLGVLSELLPDAQSVSAAVAFVTESGVRALKSVLPARGGPELEIVVRAGGVTTPEAVLSLRDDLGASVALVIGQGASAFHPKLWLIRLPDCTAVVSGSGNLTEGGLRENVEQFEVLYVERYSEAAEEHERRFDLIAAGAFSLDEIEGEAIWREWLAVIRQQRDLQSQLRNLERRLDSREVRLGREGDKRRLLEDLEDLYTRTVEARLPTLHGRAYNPSRFRQGLDRCHKGADPVLMVGRICRSQTLGFDVILAAGRVDLTIEQLALDEDRPYHDLFSDTTLRLSEERLRQFN